MTSPLPLFLALAGLIALYAFMCAWSRKDTWARPAAIFLLPVALVGLGAAYIESLGYHRPVSQAWFLAASDMRVLAVSIEQDVAIWLYVEAPSRREPLPLQLPFDNATADKIAKMVEQSQQDGNEGAFMFRFDPSLDIHPDQMHPLPQGKVMPPKEPAPPPVFYQDS